MPKGNEAPKPIVLLVDDDPIVRRLVAITLRGLPVQVLEAASALDGLRMAREVKPALLFLDIGLGREDGVRVLTALKSEPATSSIRVVMLSARDDEETRARARQAGADGFFAKPFSPLALWRAVEQATAS